MMIPKQEYTLFPGDAFTLLVSVYPYKLIANDFSILVRAVKRIFPYF
jgi:hypothetical protein